MEKLFVFIHHVHSTVLQISQYQYSLVENQNIKKGNPIKPSQVDYDECCIKAV